LEQNKILNWNWLEQIGLKTIQKSPNVWKLNYATFSNILKRPEKKLHKVQLLSTLQVGSSLFETKLMTILVMMHIKLLFTFLALTMFVTKSCWSRSSFLRFLVMVDFDFETNLANRTSTRETNINVRKAYKR
jgi:hypothetical protein